MQPQSTDMDERQLLTIHLPYPVLLGAIHPQLSAALTSAHLEFLTPFRENRRNHRETLRFSGLGREGNGGDSLEMRTDCNRFYDTPPIVKTAKSDLLSGLYPLYIHSTT